MTVSPETTEMLRSIERGELSRHAHAALFIWAEFKVETYTLFAGESLVLGRTEEADIRVDLPSISRRHARFDFDGTEVQVTDLGSRNGTWLEGRRISQVALPDGSHIAVGKLLVGARVFRRSGTESSEPELVGTAEVSGSSRTRVRAHPDASQPTALWIGAKMRELESVVQRLAPLDIPVLVVGETGTGKELIARALHDTPTRVATPFRALNCGAIPASLVESVLFGHVRGAFTGAQEARGGIFEEAGPGTVFLDEIGELSLPAQTALLRVLENRTVSRVGSTKEIAVHARVVTATHRDLVSMAAAGTFREDLLHRLNTVVLAVPPLRERREEIRPLAELFIAKALAAFGRDEIWVDDALWRTLERAKWTGNVRELRNALTRGVALCTGDTLTAEGLRVGAPAASIPKPRASSEHASDARPAADIAAATLPPLNSKKERRARELSDIRAALARTAGHKARAAALLGIPERTFRRRLRELELANDDD